MAYVRLPLTHRILSTSLPPPARRRAGFVSPQPRPYPPGISAPSSHSASTPHPLSPHQPAVVRALCLSSRGFSRQANPCQKLPSPSQGEGPGMGSSNAARFHTPSSQNLPLPARQPAVLRASYLSSRQATNCLKLPSPSQGEGPGMGSP